MRPTISIVIPTFNRVNVLMDSLHAIQRQSLQDFEVLVIDNGPSQDGTCEQVQRFAEADERLIYISTTKRGDFVARTIGCKQARADLILTIDDDWEMTNPDTLMYIVHCFEEDDRLGVLGIGEYKLNDKAKGKVVTCNAPRKWKEMFKNTKLYHSGKINRWGMIGTKFTNLKMNQKHSVDHMRSCCMAFRKDVAKKFGYFPTFYVIDQDHIKFFIGYRSETEFCRRFAKAGYNLMFSTEIQGLHRTNSRQRGIPSRSQTPDFLYATGRNNMLFFLRNYWSRPTSVIFFLWDMFVGNSTQPGFFRFLVFRHLRNKRKLTASLLGKLHGFIEYHAKYHNLQQTS